jgi:hypothetical protein
MKNFFFQICRTFLVLLVVSTYTNAQQPFDGINTPGRYFDTVFDRNGTKYALGEIAVKDALRGTMSGSYEALTAAGCTSGYFQMYLEPGCGFDGSSPAAVARLNVLCQVLHDVSAFLPCGLIPGTGQQINLWVRKIGSIPGGGSGIGIASSFFIAPSSSTISGIADNTIWITMHSGVDAYTNVAGPLSVVGGGPSSTGTTFFHGYMAFDTTYNYHTDLSTPPDTGEIDLYTLALHEVSHALGFGSLINFNGNSRLGTTFKYYTRYDQHLQTSGGTALLTHTGSCSNYNWGFNSGLTATTVLSPGGCSLGYVTDTTTDTTVCATAVKYVDGIITNQPVYTPQCYEPGASLSHFEDQCYVPGSFSLSPPASNNHYFLMANSVLYGQYPPGAMKRYFKPEERQVLCDIGYKTDTVFGDSANLNYSYYSGGICDPMPVAGINDGIDTDGTFIFYTPAGIGININGGTSGGSLLDNDNNADSFQCLQVVQGSGTISWTSGSTTNTVSYTPTIGTYGVHLLRYIPFNSATGVRGNITYVYVYVGDTVCDATACNMVPNGSFENANFCSIIGYGIHCWDVLKGSPDGFSRTIPCAAPVDIIPNAWLFAPTTDVHYPGTTPAGPVANNFFAGFFSDFAYTVMEAIQSPLAVSVVSGTTYHVSCWAKLADKIHSTTPNHIAFYVHPSYTPLTLASITGPLPLPYTLFWTFEVTHPDNNWHYYDTTFTYTGPTNNRLIVMGAPWLNTINGVHYNVVDDIKILPAS